MSEPGDPVPTPEQVQAVLNDPNVTWEDVPADQAPPVMSEANAAELLRQAAEEN